MNIISTQYTLAYRSFEIYIAGCNAQPHCAECFSPETWDFDKGEMVTESSVNSILEKIKENDSMIDNIWILGGDPIDQHPSDLFELVNKLRSANKPLWLFTRHELFQDGYLKEKYQEFYNILHYIKYVKTGAYQPDNKAKDYWVNGISLASNNQRIYTPVSLKGYVSLDLTECDYTPPVPPWTDSAEWMEIESDDTREGSLKKRNDCLKYIQSITNDFVIQPAPKTLDKFLVALRRVYAKDNHCPCVIRKSEPFRCMCSQFRTEAKDGAVCHCGLYKKVKKGGADEQQNLPDDR